MTLTIEQVKGDKAILESLRAEWLAEQNGSADAKAKDAKITALTEEVAGLKKNLDEHDVREKVAAKKALASKLITEANLPAEVVSATFTESVEAAADEAGMKKLIEDRSELAKKLGAKGGSGKPVSKSQHVTEGGTATADAKDFASRICG